MEINSMTKDKGYKIVNLRTYTSGKRSNYIYAELRDKDDNLIISATLDYIEGRLLEILKYGE